MSSLSSSPIRLPIFRFGTVEILSTMIRDDASSPLRPSGQEADQRRFAFVRREDADRD